MIEEKQQQANVWRNPIHFFAFGFGSGLAPFAPGTFGTLVAIPIYLLMSSLPLMTYIALTVVLFVMGVWLCQVTAKDMGVHDHGGIVWDEIVGYLITMIAVPSGWMWVILGFVLFRLFDITKPWPIRQVDRQMGGGLGIMFDDVLAAFYAWLLIQLLIVIAM